MNIHEYQAKAILKEFGIPIPLGYPLFTPLDASEALREVPGPVWVVKAQIHAGGRGKGQFKESAAGEGGGVRLARTAEEVQKFAAQMLGSTLVTLQTGAGGKPVHRLYVEQGADIAQEFYLSFVLDPSTERVCFVVSAEGGMDIEEVAHRHPKAVHTLPLDPVTGIMPFHGRRFAQILNLKGDLAKQGEKLLQNFYRAFISKDMSLLEVNPLIVTAQQEFLCLDAKISFDSNALYRQPDVAILRDISEEDSKEIEASAHDLSYIALDGTIGCMVNGAGLAMATMDIIKLYGESPANFLDVGGTATQEKVAAAFKIITSDLNVKGILVNIFGGIMRCNIIAEGIVAAIQEVGLRVPLVVRLEGTNVDLGKKILSDSGLNVIPAENLEDAAKKIVQVVQEKRT